MEIFARNILGLAIEERRPTRNRPDEILPL